MEKIEVFISYKHTDGSGNTVEDCRIAEQLYQELKGRGIPTFMSGQSIFQLGMSDYKKAIDAALQAARLLIVIAAQEEYLTSGWIEYEYETFYEDILSRRKTGASIVSYTMNIPQDALPRTLARFQNYSISDTSVAKMADFVELTLSRSGGKSPENAAAPAGTKKDTRTAAPAVSSFAASAYASDYSNELKRLEIQAKNAQESDRVVLDWLYAQEPWAPDEKLCVLDLGSAYGFVAADRFGNDPRVEKVLCVDYNARVIERAKIIFAENPKMVFDVLDCESDSFEDDLRALLDRHGIEKLHIVFSALVLLHLRDPNRMLRRLRRVMQPGSYLIVRGSDDGSKLCHPNPELMEEIIRRCNEIFTSDRGNGRKLYSQLSNSGFRDVRVFSTMTDTSRFDFNGRSALFEESFAYRADAFRRRLESDPQNVQYQRDYQWIQDALEQFENQFFETNFWYCEYDYSAIGRR